MALLISESCAIKIKPNARFVICARATAFVCKVSRISFSFSALRAAAAAHAARRAAAATSMHLRAELYELFLMRKL
jgi:hypothetical protein